MPPPFLYKYRQDSEFTKRIFIDRKIWLATPDALNDPAECKTGLIPDEWRRQKIAEMESAQLLGLFGPPLFDQPETLFSLDRQNTKRWFKRLKKLPHDRKIKAMRKLYRDHGVELSDPRILFETFQQQLSSVGIFSLSECPDSPPMWAHYAGNHSGLTLRFAVHEGNKLGDPIHTIPVTYSDTKPTFKSGFMHQIETRADKGRVVSKGSFSFEDPVFRASISTKPHVWSYEREWRYVEEKGGPYEFPGDLEAIIFGYKMGKERRDHYTSLLGPIAQIVQLFEIAISGSGTFEVRPFK